MVGLVARGQRALVLDHAEHLHAGAGLVLAGEQRTAVAGAQAVLEQGGKHRVARTVGLVEAGGDGFGVGDIAGDGVQPSVLGTHAGAGDIEDAGQGHGLALRYSPRRAPISPLNLLLRKVKLAWNCMAFSV
ncbi:hypothetical protein D3C81_1942180 [compost metagenome]